MKNRSKNQYRRRKILATGGIVTTLFLSGGIPSSTHASNIPSTVGKNAETIKGKFQYNAVDIAESATGEDNFGFVDSVIGEIGEKNSRDLLESQGFSPSQINKILKDY